MKDDRKILFLDIETVSGASKLSELPNSLKTHWEKKAKRLFLNQSSENEVDSLDKSYEDRSGIYAEFGKIICISVGLLAFDRNSYSIRLKSFAGDDERLLLEEFIDLLSNKFNNPNTTVLCGHNIKEFDIPYICRRMLVHNIEFPNILQLSGKKPWEIKHLVDTMEMWRFGDIKNFTSLDLLAAVLEVPSPKDDIDGSMVSEVYWKEKNLDRIVIYCEKDVVTVANVYLRMNGKPLISKVISTSNVDSTE
jgi:3'-5' exonuclease